MSEWRKRVFPRPYCSFSYATPYYLSRGLVPSGRACSNSLFSRPIQRRNTERCSHYGGYFTDSYSWPSINCLAPIATRPCHAFMVRSGRNQISLRYDTTAGPPDRIKLSLPFNLILQRRAPCLPDQFSLALFIRCNTRYLHYG